MIHSVERIVNNPSSLRTVEDTVRIATRLLSLPGVASGDWCERAARLLQDETGATSVGVAVTHVSATGALDKSTLDGFAGRPEHCAAMPTVLEAMRRTPVAQLPLQGARVTSQMISGPQLANAPWSSLGAMSSWIGFAAAHADATETGQRCVVVLMAQGPHDKIAMTTADAALRIHAAASSLAAIVRGFGTPEIAWVTPREQEVLELLVLGYSVREIGEKLGRSPHTVHDYVKSMHRKLQAGNRGALVARALGQHRFSAVELKTV